MGRFFISEQAANDPTPAAGKATLYVLTGGQLAFIDSNGKITKLTASTTNDNAVAGTIGEYISATAAPGAVALTTGVSANVTSISLTAGDWDVTGLTNFTPGATTNITQYGSGPSSTTAALGAQDTYAQIVTAAQVTGANIIDLPLPTVRFSLAGTTTIFLVARASFTVSTLTAGGTIRARRAR